MVLSKDSALFRQMCFVPNRQILDFEDCCQSNYFQILNSLRNLFLRNFQILDFLLRLFLPTVQVLPAELAAVLANQQSTVRIVGLPTGASAVPQFKGSSHSMSLGSAIATEMKNKPPGSSLVIANSSERVIPAANGHSPGGGGKPPGGPAKRAGTGL